jgi:hypothetical protein
MHLTCHQTLLLLFFFFFFYRKSNPLCQNFYKCKVLWGVCEGWWRENGREDLDWQIFVFFLVESVVALVHLGKKGFQEWSVLWAADMQINPEWQSVMTCTLQVCLSTFKLWQFLFFVLFILTIPYLELLHVIYRERRLLPLEGLNICRNKYSL